MRKYFSVSILVIFFIYILSCYHIKKDEAEKQLFGINELSDLKDYISDSVCDTCLISWKLFNRVGFSKLKVYSLDTLNNHLKFFAVNKLDKYIAIYFENDTFYVYRLEKIVPKDRANVLIE